MTPMLEALIAERLQPRSGGAGLFRRVLKITGRSESDVDARAQPVYSTWLTAPIPIATTILAVMGQIELRLTAAAPTATKEAALESAVQQLRDALGPIVYSLDGRPWKQSLAICCERNDSRCRLPSRVRAVCLRRGSLMCRAAPTISIAGPCAKQSRKEEWLGVPSALMRRTEQ
jgi:hypothetical protein